MSKIEEARKIRAFIEDNATLLTDEAALDMPDAFPRWKADEIYNAGYRVRFAETLYKCLTEHTSQDSWNPAEAPSLWAEVLPGQDGEIGEWVQPDSTNAYMTGDKVTHNGFTWESAVDNNVWEPGVYGWNQL